MPSKRLRLLKIDQGLPIDWNLLALYHDVVENVIEISGDPAPEHDLALCLKNIPTIPGVELDRLILFQTEPPLASNRKFAYAQSSALFAFFCFSPFLENHFSISSDPSAGPYSANQKHFEDLNFIPPWSTCSLYYAGKKGQTINRAPDLYGSINLYPVRDLFIAELIECKAAKVFGKGWDVVNPSIAATQIGVHEKGFRFQKQVEISDANPRYVLALENSMLPNYISEKIHDGFASDRVTLYLGAPNVDDYIPSSAYICLKPFFDQSMKTINTKDLIAYLSSVSDKEYESIRESARVFREQSVLRSKYVRIDTTMRLLDVLRSY